MLATTDLLAISDKLVFLRGALQLVKDQVGHKRVAIVLAVPAMQWVTLAAIMDSHLQFWSKSLEKIF